MSGGMILQSRIPYDTAPRKLPGIAPLDMADWLHVDDAYAAQIAERRRLLRERTDDVLWVDPVAQEANRELLEAVLAHLPDGFRVAAGRVHTPDGRVVTPDPEHPFQSCADLVQEDFCVLQKEGAEHVLRAACLCFPAGWSLSEKAGRPLVGIHQPVPDYDGNIARRVQRLFDGVRPGRPLWRFNALWYDDATLFQPRRADERRQPVDPATARFFRSERQCILRLPHSNAVVFSIHTYVVARPAVRA